MNDKRILIGGPVRQDPAILAAFLASLGRLEARGLELAFAFVDDNDVSESRELLAAFSKQTPRVIIIESSRFGINKVSSYKRDTTHHWKKDLIERISVFKNEIIRMARDEGYDYLFLLDSDLVLNPATIRHLIARGVDIVSEVFWTSWEDGSKLVPQVWLQDENAYFKRDWDHPLGPDEIRQQSEDFINMLKVPGLYEVGGLGACTLISRKAIERGISFDLVDNVSFWGEDRHFCIRARAMGLGLYVDTVIPAYHIYRKTLLDGVGAFIEGGFDPNKYVFNVVSRKNVLRKISSIRPCFISWLKRVKRAANRLFRIYWARKRSFKNEHHLTVSMIVHNESGRYLRDVLLHARKYADRFVVIDDASTDNTVEIVEEALSGADYRLIRNDRSMFANEVRLRRKQWLETLKSEPEWILFLDSDEMLEDAFIENKMCLMENRGVDGYCFRLFDFWKEGYYRDDEYWSAHTRHAPFMIRYQPRFRYRFKNTRQHCGRMPKNVLSLPYANSTFRVKHFGWMREEDRRMKYERYKRLDSDARYGIAAQYESILDESPVLREF